jgi:DNA-directed RNA polymerase subunit omega
MLVNMVARRVRQIREGSEYLVNSPKNEDVVVSLREIAAGKLTLKPGSEGKESEATGDMAALEEVELMVTTNQDVETDSESGEITEEPEGKKEE